MRLFFEGTTANCGWHNFLHLSSQGPTSFVFDPEGLRHYPQPDFTLNKLKMSQLCLFKQCKAGQIALELASGHLTDTELPALKFIKGVACIPLIRRHVEEII